MATTSPDNLRTPNPGDPYNLVADLATLANDVQSALNLRANTYKGTASSRTAFTGSATAGTLWQDTDDINMLWRKSGSSWVPAVWRWGGTTAQRGTFTAPVGFQWVDTNTGQNFVRVSGGWGALDRAKTTLTLASGFTTAVGSPIVWMSNGVVTLVINAFRSGWNNLQTITTLPTWARPPETLPSVGIWAGDPVELKINPDGTVTGQPATSLNGVIGSCSYAVVPTV